MDLILIVLLIVLLMGGGLGLRSGVVAAGNVFGVLLVVILVLILVGFIGPFWPHRYW